MPNFNIDADPKHTYDAIVIGSGISGGWAAKELCEKGLKTLVLERGPVVEHPIDYTTANLDPWDMELRGGLTPEQKEKHYKAIRSGFIGQDTEHFFANDKENPYTEVKPFLWIRGHQMGGRS
ncbi:MAG TPA: GMC family oxidoreductase, partial [Muricauda sp.]|nr:GMC family oxidoreductase [Allomuricauda sp.]